MVAQRIWQFVIDSYNGVMEAKYNPLRLIPDADVRHIITLSLMWMWAVVFSVWTGTVFYLGSSIFFHSLLFFALLLTLGTFKIAAGYSDEAIASKPISNSAGV